MKRVFTSVLFAMGMVCSAGIMAQGEQNDTSVEELEKLVEEQKLALEEAIANREATKERAAAVREALSESEERKQAVEQELKTLCEEQEAAQAGTFDDCMGASNS